MRRLRVLCAAVAEAIRRAIELQPVVLAVGGGTRRGLCRRLRGRCGRHRRRLRRRRGRRRERGRGRESRWSRRRWVCRQATAGGAVDTTAAHVCRYEVVVVVIATVRRVVIVPGAPRAVRSDKKDQPRFFRPDPIRGGARRGGWRGRRAGLFRWRLGRRSGRRDTWVGLGLGLGLG